MGGQRRSSFSAVTKLLHIQCSTNTTTNAIHVATISLGLAQIPNGSEVAFLLASFPWLGPIKTDAVRLGCPSNMVGKAAGRVPLVWYRLSKACSK